VLRISLLHRHGRSLITDPLCGRFDAYYCTVAPPPFTGWRRFWRFRAPFLRNLGSGEGSTTRAERGHVVVVAELLGHLAHLQAPRLTVEDDDGRGDAAPAVLGDGPDA
jgi:hypothetical protein